MTKARDRKTLNTGAAGVAPILLTVEQVAVRLGVVLSTVWRGVATGRLPKPVYVGSRSPRWREDELMQALSSLQASPTEAKAARRAASIAATKNDNTRAA